MEGTDYSSLLPYIDSDIGNCSLRIALISQDAKLLERSFHPFSVIDDSDPLSRMIEAEFVTDSGNTLRRAFLLVQKDQYRIKKEELWPLGNRDVDESWHKAFSFYSRLGRHSPFIVLSGQMEGAGGLSRFSPLFFCTHRKLFFHPPCPQCGMSLKLCENDDLLTREGLRPYSSSLKRYLFCPTCSSSGRAEYYVYEKDGSDTHAVKDRQQLIGDFGLLSEKDVQKLDFPCMQCEDLGTCYGAESVALSRVAPFCFYPFYLFVFDAMSINAVDFLSLLSGASFDELEAQIARKGEVGRLHHLRAIKQDAPLANGFLFDRGERHFLEVLYLKTTFLEQVLQKLPLSISPYEHPDLRPSLDRVWVRIADTDGLLPLLWNFRVEVMDIARSPAEPENSREGVRQQDLFMLGLLWFTALVANSRQDNSTIVRLLGEATAGLIMNDNPSDVLVEPSMRQALCPENIFWNPDGKSLREERVPLWERSVRLGWSLIEGSFLRDSRWSKDAFLEQLNGLREEIRSALFSEETSERRTAMSEGNEASKQVSSPRDDEAINRRPPLSEDDGAIGGILANILNRWQAEAPSAAQDVKEPEALQETVIIAPTEAGGSIPARSQPKEIRTEEFLTQTVVVGPGETADPTRLGDVSSSKESESSDQDSPLREEGGDPHPDDLIDETVMFTPPKTRDKRRRGKHEQ